MLEVQEKTSLVYFLAGKPKKLGCFFAQRKFPDEIDHYATSRGFRNLPIHLSSFNKSQIGVQFGLKHQEVLSLVLIPVEVIADRKQHVTGLVFDGHEINFIGLVNRHLRLSQGRNISTLVGGIFIPPSYPGLPVPTIVAPLFSISEKKGRRGEPLFVRPSE
jgi:hypothetical protein